METFWILCLGLLYLDPINCLPEEFKTEVRGYGNTHECLMKPRCDYTTRIAVRDLFATSKDKSFDCPVTIVWNSVYEENCIVIEEGDCTHVFDLDKRDLYFNCSGEVECDVAPDWQQMSGTCGSTYMENSNIMSMEYNCIPSASIMNFNADASQTDVTETYISNEGFPNALTSSSEGTCFITSCSTINVGLIDLRFSKSGGVCQQSLKISDGETTTVYDCDDNNRLQYKQKYTSVTSSIYVTLNVTSQTPESFVWIDASGDSMAVYCGESTSFTPLSDLDCSTTTQSTPTDPSTSSPTSTTDDTSTTQRSTEGPGKDDTSSTQRSTEGPGKDDTSSTQRSTEGPGQDDTSTPKGSTEQSEDENQSYGSGLAIAATILASAAVVISTGHLIWRCKKQSSNQVHPIRGRTQTVAPVFEPHLMTGGLRH